MAILIVENLDAMQEEPELPMRVDLQQTLESTETSETVDLEYWLDDDHDVWFEEASQDGQARRSKDGQVRREEIASVGTQIRHRVKLVHGPGDEAERVSLHQALTDSFGTKITDFDQTFIVIKR